MKNHQSGIYVNDKLVVAGNSFKHIHIVSGQINDIAARSINVDGKTITLEDAMPMMNIQVIGQVQHLECTSGNISVNGNVQEIETTNANVDAKDVSGNIKTINGNIRCRHVKGMVQTVNGDIYRS